MKQFSAIADILKIINNSTNKPFVFSGFHPDLFSLIIKNSRSRFLILIDDEVFDSTIKFFEAFSERNDTVFINNVKSKRLTPQGFDSNNHFHLKRSKEMLSEGVDHINLMLVARSSIDMPLVGIGVKDRLKVSSECSFDDCCAFFEKERYILSDFVLNPGEYSVRGGIIDVFLYSRERPYRINFLDDSPIVNVFELDSQLTGPVVSGLEIVSLSEKKATPISQIELKGFTEVSFDGSSILKSKSAGKHTSLYSITTITFRDFYKKKGVYLNIESSPSLSSVGVLLGETLLVPEWFLNKRLNKPSIRKNIIPINLSEIKKGDFLVHRDHGVCIFLGLLQKMTEGGGQEFISLKFSDGGTVLVDSARLDLITFYASAESEGTKLDSLSKKGAWIRKISSAQAQAEETISSLLNLYVKRNDLKRTPFVKNTKLEEDFILSFPYKDTVDQSSAWKEISKDLSSSQPMDRLLCGDVGFGKTELAIRAAFRVAVSNKRVVVLSPTTILANQLYSSFVNRVENYGLSVDMVSRFRSKKELVQVESSIKGGLNDILIGTHALLNKSIYLKNIGLVVIDEEHRFGVRQKEKIKEFKGGVDVLSMSATPIPRSMNMAISKIYSISTLQTPPRLRLPIKTRVLHYNFELIKEAIFFEINRGGQVYFVHNDVSSIKNMTSMIASCFDKYAVEFIHGQEPSSVIEKKMVSFINGKIDILICTTIIESGIDVPGANSIIINNAHLFGLSQLYQMRGRVGRGQYQAYAYLLIPRGLSLMEKSFKRIKSIEQNVSLGSGYNISMADMEIRGAGSLFGYKQSGGSGSLGYEMYTKMIQRSLHESGKLELNFKLLPEDVVVNIYSNRLIPEDYIYLESVRLSIYKSISIASSEPELNNLSLNLENRFGPIPNELVNLINEHRLKLLSSKVGINSIKRGSCGIIFSISDTSNSEYIKSLVDYSLMFFNKQSFTYHVLPNKGPFFSVCIHLDKNEDIYTFFLRFLGKFSNTY